ASWPNLQQSRCSLRIVINFPAIRKRTVESVEVQPAASEPAKHVRTRDVVSALPHAGRDATQREARRRQAQVNNLDVIASGFPAFEAAKVNQSAQSGLEGEVHADAGEAIQFR